MAQSKINIEEKDTIADLHNKVNKIFPEILTKVLSDIELNKVKLKKQNNKMQYIGINVEIKTVV